MIGDIIELKGISRHGKNRVREFGKDWIVLSEPEPMICFDGEPGIRIAPIFILVGLNISAGQFIGVDKNNSRNIRFPDDDDFVVCFG